MIFEYFNNLVSSFWENNHHNVSKDDTNFEHPLIIASVSDENNVNYLNENNGDGNNIIEYNSNNSSNNIEDNNVIKDYNYSGEDNSIFKDNDNDYYYYNNMEDNNIMEENSNIMEDISNNTSSMPEQSGIEANNIMEDNSNFEISYRENMDNYSKQAYCRDALIPTLLNSCYDEDDNYESCNNNLIAVDSGNIMTTPPKVRLTIEQKSLLVNDINSKVLTSQEIANKYLITRSQVYALSSKLKNKKLSNLPPGRPKAIDLERVIKLLNNKEASLEKGEIRHLIRTQYKELFYSKGLNCNSKKLKVPLRTVRRYEELIMKTLKEK